MDPQGLHGRKLPRFVRDVDVSGDRRHGGSGPDLPLGDIEHAYSRSKVLSEVEARTLQDAGQPVVTVYPGAIFGPGDPYVGSQTERFLWVVRGWFPIWSKGGVLAMTRELAIVHAREGFRFNALCPAPLNTPLLQDWLGDDQPKRHRREVHFPSGRFGEAIEQAQAVLFLASDEASFVNGSDFVVDGGMTKAYVTPEGPATAAPTNLAR